MSEEIQTSRTAELVLGILGGVFGLIGGVFALFFSAFESSIGVLGLSAILASIVGIIGTVYIKNNPKLGSIIVVISSFWLLISISLFGVLGFILLLIAGILGLIRK
ncbi:DUF4064 domain-containing protein [Methanobrevibacter filiformis]|uniref:DUF4064 domain-containing protein n=1 Tax=Methanobrevibacter filiformis TaxID=55758 RepID=A0A166DFE4_9EURY|nr:DUF4064 domain-containing protein [Methanobrevibacter filiformis]KZX15543.1 hypothetical protein MBFIL_06350 [Methanobrevibacter filiformis]